MKELSNVGKMIYTQIAKDFTKYMQENNGMLDLTELDFEAEEIYHLKKELDKRLLIPYEDKWDYMDNYEIEIMVELKMKEIETINLHMKEDLLRIGAFQCDYQSEINKLNSEIQILLLSRSND